MSLDYSFKQLPDADFRNQDLRGASFRYAYLHKADFRGANLEGADFWGADLREALFDGCEDEPIDRTDYPLIQGTSFLHADVGFTVFDVHSGYDAIIQELLRPDVALNLKYEEPEDDEDDGEDDDEEIEDLKAETRKLRQKNIQLKRLVYRP